MDLEQSKMDPIVALQSKLGELLQDPDADESIITLLRDRLKQLQDERDPAAALAERLQIRTEMLEKMTGNKGP